MPSVSIRVVPTSAGVNAVFGGAFHSLKFPTDKPLVCLDTYVGGIFLAALANESGRESARSAAGDRLEGQL